MTCSTIDCLLTKYGKSTLTPEEFAAETGVSKAHVRRLCANGSINAAKLGKLWIIPVVECAAIIDGTKRKPVSPFVG